jgi:Tol biopolymer transport system component
MSSLEEGHLLGRYRVEAFLAQGGMGRIYRAVDTVLGRRVALKVLADRSQPGSPAIARLLREARAAAALSHPNICSVFDVGEIEGQPFIAMELVQGTSLRLLLADPETGLERRLRWVHDLACALAAAHRAGIVHRDIKPDNVMVARDGRVRLLDFGVAKWEDARGEPGDGSVAVGGLGTQEGQVIGTTGYMAPEQAEGGHVDGRTDQFAWGVVAYETISGRHPFGEHGGFGEPPLLSGIVPALPFGVAAVIAKALALEPSLRFADMDEIVAVLQPLVGASPPLPPAPRGPEPLTAPGIGSAADPATSPAASEPRTGASEPRADTTRVLRRRTRRWWTGPRQRRVLGVGALAIAGGAAIGIVGWVRAGKPQATPATSSLELRVSHVRRITFGDRCEEFPSFLPDGRAVVYDGDDGTGNYVVYRLDLDEGATPRVIVHQDDPGWDMAPSVSPSGDHIVFVHRGKKYSGAMVAGMDGKEPPRALGVPTMYPRWSSDGRGIWAGKSSTLGLYDVATGNTLRTLALPSGTRAIGMLERGDGAVIAQLNSGASGDPSGLVMFAADGSLRWQIREEVLPGVAWAPDGRHVIASRQSIAGQAELIALAVDRAGAAGARAGAAGDRAGAAGDRAGAAGADSPIVSLASTGVAPRDGLDVSRDGTRIAWSTCGQTPRVSLIDAAGRYVATLTREEADVNGIARMPGGRDLLVVSQRTGRQRLWVMDSAGERPPRQLDIGERSPREATVSPDGARFAAVVPGAGIGVGNLRGDTGFRMLTDQSGDDAPCFRKAGDALVFNRHHPDGTSQVMVVPVGGGPAVALLGPGTRDAAISPVDDTIVYLEGVTSSPVVADARGLGGRSLSPALPGPDYSDLRFSPDGARVLLLRANQELLEVDVARGTVLRSLAAAPGEAFYSPFYAASGPAVIRVRWQGSIYVADAAWSR